MSGDTIIQGVVAFVGGSGTTAIFNYLRGAKKDVRQDTLAWHTELMKEQRDWRDTLRREVNVLQEKLTALQAENASLLREVAELKAHNDDLKRDNEEMKRDNEGLESRVEELERELKKHDAAALIAAPLVGL